MCSFGSFCLFGACAVATTPCMKIKAAPKHITAFLGVCLKGAIPTPTAAATAAAAAAAAATTTTTTTSTTSTKSTTLLYLPFLQFCNGSG